MRSSKILFILMFTLISSGCLSKNKERPSPVTAERTAQQDLDKMETAYFASGCFWCVEAIFESVKGVAEVVSGYSGGTEKNPTYEQVGRGLTSHAEAVKVYYDPKVVSFATLVTVFFGSHDPTTLNRQGPDHGAQYRSIAFYKNDQEKKIITDHIAQLQAKKTYPNPIVTQVVPFSKFYDAEDYHQDYEKNNPNNPYVLGVSVPRLKRFQKKFPELLKSEAH
ncbi:MAG: peptide-methionine (S)-S-oxide reductase MsrA [Sediminicola sp.]